ncbi:MAG: formyltransferase [Pseudomonadota bacterium]
MTSAVVFAYHQVGVRCLEVLLEHNIDVALIFTHQDDPKELLWFPSVAECAKNYNIRVVKPEHPNTEAWAREIENINPDFIFSFYYRYLISDRILSLPSKGSLNMHGSLLPKYRGRVPINWAVLHGEKESGASLHYMVAKADQGDIVDQAQVPILRNDTAFEVFQKVCTAAECVLHRSLPALIQGSAVRRVQDATQASYFGRRTPAQGEIDWSKSAWDIHNLIRAVAPPYPGAFFEFAEHRFIVEKSLYVNTSHVPAKRLASSAMFWFDDETSAVWVRCGDENYLQCLCLRYADNHESDARLLLKSLLN